MLNEYPRQQLTFLIGQFGRSICHDSKRCEAVLRDLCPEHKREVNLLVAALKEQVVADLLSLSPDIPLSLFLNQLASRLHDNLGIAENFAIWSVESWALALNVIENASTASVSNTVPSLAAISTVTKPVAKSTALKELGSALTKLFAKKTAVKPIQAQSAQHKPIFFHDKLKNGKPALKMVRITGGRFMMGSPLTETGRYSIERYHEVVVADFIIGQYPVTFADYDLFVKASGARKPTDNGWGRGLRPVIHVSWKDALSYAAWLSEQTGQHYRLPTEAEWEYAARAGTTTAFATGDVITTEQANFNGQLDYGQDALGLNRKQTVEVGSFPANNYGLYDMHGNVWEWTASTYSEDYNGEECRCFDSTLDTYRMLRGGSWVNTKRSVRSASRIRRDCNDKADFIGFRLARDV